MDQLYWCPLCEAYVTKKLYSGGQESYFACSTCGSFLEHKKKEFETEHVIKNRKHIFLDNQLKLRIRT